MPELEAERSEEERVQGWRFENLLELGFTVAESERLSEAGVSHHEAELLLNAGCPTRTAYRLLRPVRR